jgi:hypothetical protein
MEADTVLMKTKLVSICYALIADIAKSAGPVEKLSATPRPLRNSSKTVPKKTLPPGRLESCSLGMRLPSRTDLHTTIAKQPPGLRHLHGPSSSHASDRILQSRGPLKPL